MTTATITPACPGALLEVGGRVEPFANYAAAEVEARARGLFVEVAPFPPLPINPPARKS